MSTVSIQQILEEKGKLLKIEEVKYHIFLCCDQTKPKCCTREAGLESWDFLKNRLSDLGLSPGSVFRSKANCLRFCQFGPIAVVFPGPIWYHSCTPEVLEKIIQKHFLSHQLVTENVINLSALNQ